MKVMRIEEAGGFLKHLLAPTKTFTLRGGTDVNIAARRVHPKITFTKMFSILVTPPILDPFSYRWPLVDSG